MVDSASPKEPDSNAQNGDESLAEPSLDEIHTAAREIASKSDDIEQARIHAEKVRQEIDEYASAIAAALETIKMLEQEVTLLKESALASNQAALEAKTQAEANRESIRAELTFLSEHSAQVAGITTEALQSQEIIATKSEHIENARIHADEARAKIDQAIILAQDSAANAESRFRDTETIHSNLTTLFTTISESKTTALSEVQAAKQSRKLCDEQARTMKGIARKSENTSANIEAYEAKLVDFNTAATDLRVKLEGLLPGAASAGLASAFNTRRTHFFWPQVLWQSLFVGSVSGLLLIAWVEFRFFARPDTPPTWESIGMSLLHRLPFVLPLVWMAFHAAHKAALAQRVEEDYAFKETVSRSFEGYRREMAELAEKAEPETALSRLCDGVLSIITNPPGRIYDRHELTSTPLNAVSDSLLPLAKELSKGAKLVISLDKPPEIS